MRSSTSEAWKGRALTALWIGPPLAYLLLFIVLPYGNILQFSFWRKDAYSFVFDPNIDNYLRIVANPLYRGIVWTSLKVATSVTVATVLVSYPIAFFLAFHATRHRSLLYFLMIIPVWFSFLIRAFIWKIILGRSGVLNQVLLDLGFIEEATPYLLYNFFSIFLALTYIFIPFMVLPIFTALEKIDRSHIEAAMDLGGSRVRTFCNVILPLSLPGVLAGATFTFCLSFGDFVTPALLGAPENMMISSIIISQFGTAFNWPFGSALATLVILLVMAVVVAMSLLERRRS